jgi:hypothetical protein
LTIKNSLQVGAVFCSFTFKKCALVLKRSSAINHLASRWLMMAQDEDGAEYAAEKRCKRWTFELMQ